MKGSAWRYALAVFIILLFSGNRLLLAQPVQIGDLITFADGSKGIVCYVDPANDQKGWVVDLNDMDTTYQLFTRNSVVNTPPMTNKTPDSISMAKSSWKPEGKANTLALFNMVSGTHYSPAATEVDPASGWYIPDANQMKILIGLAKELQPAFERVGEGNISNLLTMNRHYWTSTRRDLNHFYVLYNNSATTGARLVTSNSNISRPNFSYWIRRVRDFDFGNEPSAYWVIKPKEDSIRVSPPVTTAYDALVIYGTDTFTVQSHVIVHPTYNKDTIFGDTVYAYEDFEKIVHGYTFNVTGAGDYALYDTFPTIYGCDSILTIMLRVRAPKELAYYDTVCQSQVHNYSDGPNDAVAIALFGQSALDSLVRVSGQLIKEKVYMKDESGNDSIVSFYLTVKAKRNDTTVVVTNFHGDTYFWNDSLYTEPGSHTVYTQLTDGCDFYDVLHLVILDIDTSENVICPGDNTDLVITVTQRKDPNDTTPRYPQVGDVLCTDGSTMHPDSFLLSSKTAMGVVVSVNPRDGFGRAIALSDNTAIWYDRTLTFYAFSNTVTTNKETAMMDMDGAGNTERFMSFITSTTNEFAVTKCYYYDHTTESVGSEAHGWYLPAAGETFLMYANQILLDNTLTKLGKNNIRYSHWTSTQYSTQYSNQWSYIAWKIGPDLNSSYPHYTYGVRPFIHFTLP